ncbi:16S rRNA processing protein RimM [candidate division WOR-3 bacterium]|nr:16S rRNA processing protein RimM [candidate division WOR-3 bacterium]
MFEVGIIVKPHGLKGYVKVFITTTEKDRFKTDDTQYFIMNRAHRIENIKHLGKNIIIKFFDIDDIETADKYRNERIFISKDDLIPLLDNEYYLHDLYNCKVYDIDNNYMGIVTDIFFSNDFVLDISKEDGSTCTILFKEDFLSNVNIDEKTIILKFNRDYYEY